MEIGAVAAGIAVAADMVGADGLGDNMVGGDVVVERGIGVDAVIMPAAVAVAAVDTVRVDVAVGCCSTTPSEQAMADTATAMQSASGSNRVKSIVEKFNLHSLYSRRWLYWCVFLVCMMSFVHIVMFPLLSLWIRD